MKKMLLVLFILIISCSMLLAKGGQEDQAAPAVGTEGPKSPIQIYNPSFVFPTEKIELEYWHILGSRVGWHDWARKTAEEYSQIHPNVSISIRDVPIKEWKTVFVAAMEANTMPDVFNQFNFYINAEGGALPAPDWAVKIFDEKYIDAANAYQKFPGARKEYSGKYLGWLVGELDPGQMLYYNKGMFREAGVTVPSVAPELIDAMKKCTKYDASGNIEQAGWAMRYFGTPGGISEKWRAATLFWLRDPEKGWIFNDDWSDIADWAGDDFVQAAQIYHDMIYDWKVVSLDMPSPVEAIKLGLAAMTNRESFLSGTLINDAPDIEFGIAPLVKGAPPYGSHTPGIWYPAQVNFVSEDTGYPDVAWDFNMFMNTDERDLVLCKLTGSYPRRKVNVDTDYTRSIIWADVFEAMSARPRQRSEELDPWGVYNVLQHVTGQALERIITDENANVRQILQEAMVKGREELEAAKLASQ